jgi:hypothetical protein
VRQRFVECGLDAALTHAPQPTPRRQQVLGGAAERPAGIPGPLGRRPATTATRQGPRASARWSGRRRARPRREARGCCALRSAPPLHEPHFRQSAPATSTGAGSPLPRHRCQRMPDYSPENPWKPGKNSINSGKHRPRRNGPQSS